MKTETATVYVDDSGDKHFTKEDCIKANIGLTLSRMDMIHRDYFAPRASGFGPLIQLEAIKKLIIESKKFRELVIECHKELES